MTKSQSLELANTATQMGLAVEPDARITNQHYEWDQVVSIFPATEELSQDVASYHAAAVLLELGLTIAASDGQIDEVELGRLSSHLETQFELSTQDTARLEHLRYLLMRRPPSEFSGARKLQKTLTADQRRMIGEFLVGIAAADDEISPEEVKALGKAYRALGLEASDLTGLLQEVSIPEAGREKPKAADETFHLDPNRINAIMSETTRVAQFLRDALMEDTDEAETDDQEIPMAKPVVTPEPSSMPISSDGSVSPDAAPHSVSDQRFRGLQSRLVPFLVLAVQQHRWSRSELGQHARLHNLILGSAIEEVNEWSYENLGSELLTDGDEVIEIQLELLS